MKRLIVAMFELSLICALLSGVVIVVGRSKPQPQTEIRPELCDGAPCFMGSVPGVTAWDKLANQMMDTLPVDKRSPLVALILESETSAVFTATDDRTRVGAILLHHHKALPITVGELVSQYGSPCVILYDKMYNHLVLRYPTLNARIVLDDPTREFLTRDMALYELKFHTDPDNCVPRARANEQDMTFSRWRGFTSIERYVPAK